MDPYPLINITYGWREYTWKRILVNLTGFFGLQLV
jgi:hypothetical protein